MGILDKVIKSNDSVSFGQKLVWTKREGEIREFYTLEKFHGNANLSATHYNFIRGKWKKHALLFFPDNLIPRKIRFSDFKKAEMQCLM